MLHASVCVCVLWRGVVEICYMLHVSVCVLWRGVVEIWIILSGLFMYMS